MRATNNWSQGGAPNKITCEVEEAILNAFEKVSGKDYLVKVANETPAVFRQLVGKVLPMQIIGNSGRPVKHWNLNHITVEHIDAGVRRLLGESPEIG